MRGDIALEADGVGPDQPAVDAQHPGVAQRAMAQPFAAGAAAEENRLDAEKARARREVDLDAPSQPRAVEQDRLLRQPFEPRALAATKVRDDLGVLAGGAIDFLGRRRGDRQRGAGLDLYVERIAIAADDAAAGVDDRRLAAPRRGSTAGNSALSGASCARCRNRLAP